MTVSRTDQDTAAEGEAQQRRYQLITLRVLTGFIERHPELPPVPWSLCRGRHAHADLRGRGGPDVAADILSRYAHALRSRVISDTVASGTVLRTTVYYVNGWINTPGIPDTVQVTLSVYTLPDETPPPRPEPV